MAECIICKSSDLEYRDTVISDFVMARIDPRFVNGNVPNTPTRLCFCKNCTFAFYEYRISDEESERLYNNYRDGDYQQLREKYECWYTEQVNDALNNDLKQLRRQKARINHMIKNNIRTEIRSALDYGGNEGKTFFSGVGTEERYVYDISGIDVIDGITKISDFDELRRHNYDFIMTNMLFEHLADPVEVLRKLYELGSNDTYYYIEVPSENPFIKGNKFGILKNLHLLADPVYNNLRLAKYYFVQKNQPPMPMKEHINFFTQKSMRFLAKNCGFYIVDMCENDVLYVLLKKI